MYTDFYEAACHNEAFAGDEKSGRGAIFADFW